MTARELFQKMLRIQELEKELYELRVEVRVAEMDVIRECDRKARAWDHVYSIMNNEKNGECAKWHQMVMEDALNPPPKDKDSLDKLDILDKWIEKQQGRWERCESGRIACREIRDKICRMLKEKLGKDGR